MNYNAALNVINKKQSLGIMPGLTRIYNLLDKIDNPQEKLKIIHIAGTNGKGTVSASLANKLCQLGYKVGLFTSPWVTDYCEQIQVNSVPIDKEIFAEYVERLGKYDSTEFELLTAIMYKYFYDIGVDYAVVECGMGGLEDSTNAFSKPELAILTSISFDHTGFLGDTLEEIAKQKAGIIKNNSRVVLYPNTLVEHIIEKACEDTNSKLYKVNPQDDFRKNNLETVKLCLRVLGFDDNVDLVKLPARQEYITENILLDASHNPDGAYALERGLPNDREITAVIGMMKDKDVDKYLSIIAPHCKNIITTTVSTDRALDAYELQKIAEKYCENVQAITNPINAVKLSNYDFLLVCGSFYLAREIRKDLL